jgi:radical SAM protein with 4Fe4S-binding SPASM domain
MVNVIHEQELKNNDLSEKSSVKFLQIEPTTRCNFKCKFCLTHQIESADLSWETFVTALEQLPNLEYLKIQGQGEPLLHPLFFEMVKFASKRGIKVSTISNGSLLSPDNVEKIFDSELHNIQISIESPNPEQFKEIRGGNLEKIKEGIKLLTTRKKEEDLNIPTVGFAVTVMRKTNHLLPEISRLYNDLNMDGGIMFKFLSEMEQHTNIYEQEITDNILSSLEKISSYNQYRKLTQSNYYKKSSITNFYENLFEISDKDFRHTPYINKNNPTCPWLDRALHIDRQGEVTPCSHIIESNKFSLGKIGKTSLDTILRQRDCMKKELQSGTIPQACRYCFVAQSIVNHHNNLSKGESKTND